MDLYITVFLKRNRIGVRGGGENFSAVQAYTASTSEDRHAKTQTYLNAIP